MCVHSSKAIGEPPFFLAVSAFLAIKEALYAFRSQEAGVDGFFPLYRYARSSMGHRRAAFPLAGEGRDSSCCFLKEDRDSSCCFPPG